MAAKKPAKIRLSLTKSQIQAGVGAELLSLCQSATEDGTLSKDEILALKSWLETNRTSDLPAIAFLIATVQRIAAEGKVTKDERQELYKAIETVLPPEARKQAVAHRKVVEAKEMARDFAEREAQKRRAREERERNRPIASANFMVAGVYYEGRPEIISRYVDDGDQVFLVRDPHNKYSRNAIEVRLDNGMQIGFVPEDDAVDLAPFFDQGCVHRAYITKVLTGGRVPIPVVQACLYSEDANIEGAISASSIPEKQFGFPIQSFKLKRQFGCLSVIVFVCLPFLLGMAWLLIFQEGIAS